jgi:LuxR family transcriptional regulator, quorum-sensing system regulator SolR
MLSSASDIDGLCVELRKLGITFFSHTRIFNDGSRFDLNNHAKMIEEFYYGKEKIYELYTPEVDPQGRPDEILLLDNLEDNPSFQFLREGYNIDHMLVKIEKHDLYCDVWNFGTTKENKNIVHLYLSHLDILTLFTYFYRDKCQDLIKACEKDPIIIKTAPTTDIKIISHQNMDQLFEETRLSLQSKTNRYYLNGTVNRDEHLTKAEMECCYWIYQGKTSEEIALITDRSKRTIEKHIENIKTKLGCYNKGQLIKIVKELGIF